MELTGKQRRYLRSLGHHLKPVVTVGRAGVTDGVVQQLDDALEDHELIKMRFGRGFEDEKRDALREMIERVGGSLAASVGHTALIYRRRSEEPKIELP